MYIEEETLDDALRRVLAELLRTKNRVRASRGKIRERLGAYIRINSPRARLSRTNRRGALFSALGELLWYLSGTDDIHFIRYYAKKYDEESEDGATVYGAYGPRLFGTRGNGQLKNVASRLRLKRSSRRAVVQLFDAADLEVDRIAVPCTCVLQFAIRDKKLHMLTYMRSNDAYMGLSHDVFAFTMIQEIVASELHVGLGAYHHMVGSLHLYQDDEKAARKYVDEGWQEKVLMPRMPKGEQWTSIRRLLQAEAALRLHDPFDEESYRDLPPYWLDVLRLLQVYSLFRTEHRADIAEIRKQMKSPVYDSYIAKKERTKAKPIPPAAGPVQLSLFKGP